MDDVMAVALLSMHQDMKHLDRVAMNLSNATTPAYKRDIGVTQAANSAGHSFGSLWDIGMAESTANAQGKHRSDAQSDMRAGTLKSTGQSLDLALAGDGFFEVETASGPAYTRQGNFRTDERGRLVTAQGYPVMAKGGDVYLTTLNPVIDLAGNITENKKPLAQLKIVAFDHPEKLVRNGDGLYAAAGDMRQLPDAEVQLKQGFLENSNVGSMREMVDLMQTMRHFESMQKITQGYDEMIGNAIRKLGDM